jgi:hypothetical protein
MPSKLAVGGAVICGEGFTVIVEVGFSVLVGTTLGASDKTRLGT